MGRGLLPLAVAALVLFGALAVYFGVAGGSAYAASDDCKVTITVNMGKSGSNCPVLFFYKGGSNKALAYGHKFYTGGKKFDPWTKSKTWFKNHSVKVVFTSVSLPKGTYKVVCDNGSKTKTVISSLSVKKKMKKTVNF
ncbi:MAG: hypothetical protein LBG82_03815 [Clostridiales Family XIII bacterium]|nr:hypothetical protein [Clostridiales Family XIII bacterium]